MKTQKWIGTWVALALLIAALVGCESDEQVIIDGEQVAFVHVYAYADTLLAIPGAPHATMPGFAMVQDRGGRAMRGQAVNLTSTPQELGYIELADTVLRDTTNAFGRVEFCFHSTGVPGEVHITGSVGMISGACTLAVVESHQVIWEITITLSKELLRVGPGHPDSTLITLCFKDSAGAGIPGVKVRLFVSGGRFQAVPATDSTGCTRFWWWPECCGIQCLYWGWGEVLDSACVTVDSL